MAENVKVAVRVRPFNDREKKRNASLIIKMSGQQTEIRDPEKKDNKPKTFNFDYSYWSHDGYAEEGNGYLKPAGGSYADQKKVFNDLGKGVLDNAWEGFNCSLFAYGQTGSGKSYSMVGYGSNKGIVPITCEELFKGIEAKRADSSNGDKYEVTFSMIEIYNEQVRDLLSPESMKVKGGLKVRQHPQKGFYVEKLKLVPVNSYTDIDKKMNEGTKNRTVASTNMNATSSRAHTIVQIEFIQKIKSADGMTSRNSIINLVDLAGSERATSTGATGDRLKEGSAINQSLSTLGNCIKALASSSNGKKVTVPFRDSMLTKLLKNALGGNSKTVMIAALSPADINYEETLSTLRFADRAKSIKTKAVVNQNATEKMIADLRKENQKLLEQLKKGGVAAPDGETVSEEEMAELRREMDELIRKNQEEIENMNKSWEERLAEQQKEQSGQVEIDRQRDAQRMNVCHLWNLNEDPMLSSMIIHYVQPGKNEIGSAKNSAPDIPMSGLSIVAEHAVITNKKDKVELTPGKGKILLNGTQITKTKELHHNDRLMFGSSNLFVLHHPVDLAKMEKKKKVVPTPTFDSAQEEITRSSGIKIGDKSKDDMLLQEDLIEMWPMIVEANAMSEELDKKMKFEVALISPQAIGGKETRTQVWVKVKDLTSKNEFLWDRSKFLNRRYLMQEIYQSYVDGDQNWNVPKEKDPFWEDPNSDELIGIVHVYLRPLAYVMDMEDTLKITDYRGQEQGKLAVQMEPCSSSGGEVSDEDIVDEPEELEGRNLYFKMNIAYARGLPPRFVKIFCRYQLYLDKEYFTTAEVGGTTNPNFDYRHKHALSPVTRQCVDYLCNDSLVIEIRGRQKGCDDTVDYTTSELMSADRSTFVSVQSTEYRLAAEASTNHKRMLREKQKVEKILNLVRDAKQKGMDTVKVSDLESALRSGRRFKAVANVIAMSESKARSSAGSNRQTSEACVLQ